MGYEQTALNKITRPDITGILPRERLFTQMDGACLRPILWVNAPGGSGKTTLISSYLESRGLPSLWYQVDQGDADIASFFYYMGLASKKVSPGNRKPLPLLTPEHCSTIPIFSRRYFENLFTRLPRPFALVFDNYQDVDSPQFHDVIYAGLEAIPNGISFIIISRESLPLRFTRLQANSRIELLGWEDIRFTQAEVSELIRQKKPEGLSRQSLTDLSRKAEGWVAGLLLILEHAGKGGSDLGMEGAWTPEGVFNYFGAEVFSLMDDERRELLLTTAFLPYMTVPLAEKLTGNGRVGRFLADMTRSHYFTSRHPARETVYQYHQLFREFLLNQSEEEYGRHETVRIRSRAAKLLEESGDFNSAAELYGKVEDWQSLTSLICCRSQAFMKQGRSETVREWLALIPLEIRIASADLLYWHGAALANTNPWESLDLFRKALNLYRSNGDRPGMFLAWSAAADTNFYTAEYSVQREWYELLRGILAADPSFPSPEVETQVILSTFNVMSYSMADHPEIGCWYERAYATVLNEKSVPINQRLMTGVKLRVYSIWKGDFARAGIMHDFLGRLSRSDGVSDLVRQAIYSGSVLFCFVTGRCAEGIRIAEEAEAHRHQCGISVIISQTLAHAFSCALSNNDTAAIEVLQERLARQFNDMRHLDVVVYRLGLAWQSMIRGEYALPLQHAELVLALTRKIGFLSAEAIAHSVVAEVLAELGETDKALQELSKGYELAERLGSDLMRFFCLLVEARIAFGALDDETGLTALQRAFTLGRLHGFANKFWWRPAVMADLCARALEAGIEPEYLRWLIRFRGLTDYPPSESFEEWPWSVSIYTLGRFELHLNGEPCRFHGKIQKKPLEMLKALVALNGGEAHEGQIADLLWPESDGDTARSSVKVTLFRLRELLGNDSAVQIREGRISLDRRLVWADAWSFDKLLQSAQLTSGQEESEAVSRIKKALDLYRGQFLPDEGDKPWAFSHRTRLKSRFILNTVAVVNLLKRKGMLAEAIDCLLKGVEIDEISEELYQNLIECYLSADLRGEAVAIYRRCRTTFAMHGLSPSPKTESLYRTAIS
ncbi:HTH-type transcriptional regulator MalT [Geobacter sp. OR-1]|uniref:BTAD domain-containing putative transcriptional regulator n=1 Tax=Geobacter sp. OR-1 TaxID=1266765 RepID=UPI0005424A93|nr:BTAD domain-containing putative transcriptional regulator [Geobacter sp. OR-1]GAM10093.1 HTH-type transcriptional regulator MalT [Geobacter sp. OR-1]